jgi:hypothetical protein
VFEFFTERLANGTVPGEVEPKDWTRFCDNVVSLLWVCGTGDRVLEKRVAVALQAVEEEISKRVVEQHPLSISLWQYVFGVLARAKLVLAVPEKHWPLVTPELLSLFPAVGAFPDRFELAS